MTRRTDKFEEPEIEAMLARDRNQEPRYPIIERTDISQLANTALEQVVQVDNQEA